MRERQKKGAKGNGRDFLARCYEAQDKYPSVVTDQLIRTYDVENIIAGSDTLAIALSAVSANLPDDLPFPQASF